MPVNGVRVLPNIPKNMPNMEILIREFETGFCSKLANYRDTASKSSISSNGNFVKKIVEVYESSVRASTENSQQERSGFSSTFDIAQNRKNVEKNGSSLAIHDAPNSQNQNNFNKKSKIFLTSFEAREVEDDFVILNRYRSESNKKPISKIWPRSSPKINMYSSMDELINVQSSPSETWNLKKEDEKLEDKPMKNKLMICSSPLDDKDLDCEDPLDDILTRSCDSTSSNNSYRNLQADLFDFKNKQWLELSSTSLSSLRSSSESSHKLSVNSGNNSRLLDSSFQNVTVISSKDISKNRENLQHSKPVPRSSSNFDRKPPPIDASLNEDRPIKIDNDTCNTWISALGEKLSLKKLLKSTFSTKLLNYKKVWKKSTEKQSNERTSDSGFIERFLSSSSSSSQKSWRSDPEKSPTFETFGRAKNTCVNGETWTKKSRMVLTEVPREKFTSDSQPSDSTPWALHRTSCEENRQNVESSLTNTMLASSSKLKISCGYPPLPKHPYLIQNGIPKHPFVAETKLDQKAEKESTEKEKEMKHAKERESNMRELELSPVSQADLNISYSRMSEWLASSSNNNCDLSR